MNAKTSQQYIEGMDYEVTDQQGVVRVGQYLGREEGAGGVLLDVFQTEDRIPFQPGLCAGFLASERGYFMTFYGMLLSGGPVWVFVRAITVIFTVVALLRLVPGRNRQVANYRPRPGVATIKVTSISLGMAGMLAGAMFAYGAVSKVAPFRDYKPAHGIPLGVYTGNESVTWGGIHAFEATAGRRVSYVLGYINTGQPFPHYIAQEAAQHEAEPVIQVEPRNVSLARVVHGSDHYLKKLAREVRSYKHPVVLSWAPEANGNWYRWGWTHTPPALYRASWKRVMRIFRSDHNVRWMDTINFRYRYSAPIRDYVIPHVMIGIDGYYQHRYSKFAGVFGPTLKQVRALTREPVMISETAIGPVAGQARKLPDLLSGIRRNHLAGLIWFNADRSRYGVNKHMTQNWTLKVRIPK